MAVSGEYDITDWLGEAFDRKVWVPEVVRMAQDKEWFRSVVHYVSTSFSNDLTEIAQSCLSAGLYTS